MKENELNVRLQCATELAQVLIMCHDEFNLGLGDIADTAVDMVDEMVEKLKRRSND